MNQELKVSIAQMTPVWLNRAATVEKMLEFVDKAAERSCRLVVFGESLLPGYPFWLERTNGAQFNSPKQKELFAHYVNQAVQIEAGDLSPLCERAASRQICIAAGCLERPPERGGKSVYCSFVYIDATGKICSVHRKLMPTYEERLVWSVGDGHGLRAHRLGAFTVGGLNCWENWMPLARAAMQGLGVDLHLAIWPGSVRNTQDITRFIALESRAYVMSASGLMSAQDVPDDVPYAEEIRENGVEIMTDGGSCIAAPDGSWVCEPLVNREELIVATIDHQAVRGERQNFDPVGHYARPDVLSLRVSRQRQQVCHYDD